MEERNTLLENEEVMETVVDEVAKSGSKMSTLVGVGIGVGVVVAGYAIAKTTPKVIKNFRDKLAERKANKIEKDYISEELENEENTTLEDNE